MRRRDDDLYDMFEPSDLMPGPTPARPGASVVAEALLDESLAGVELDPADREELLSFLRSLEDMARRPVPKPSAELAFLLPIVGSPNGPSPTGPRLKRRRLIAGGLVTGSVLAGLSGVAAANDRLAAPAQRVVSGVMADLRHPGRSGSTGHPAGTVHPATKLAPATATTPPHTGQSPGSESRPNAPTPPSPGSLRMPAAPPGESVPAGDDGAEPSGFEKPEPTQSPALPSDGPSATRRGEPAGPTRREPSPEPGDSTTPSTQHPGSEST
ncbi:MAG: hypothetical protein QOE71_4067 [Pseudonocardiales bacterium]|jgi:hypothetical protein|nr:hypothetical protein [Pseudonocardiales bacterium]